MVLVLVTALVAACTRNSPVSHSSPSPASSKLAWTDCGKGFQCASVEVPLDYAHPTAGTISIAVNRKPATDQAHRIGSLLTNPGGPGASGLSFIQDFAGSMTNINRRFDLIGFDPRGIGKSTPVSCVSVPDEEKFNALDSVLDDQQEKQAAIDADKAFAAGCQQRSAKMLPFVDTESVARDMDVIRAALGDSKLTYLGFSYGTYIGELYAHLFPTRIRALALDGVVDPSLQANDELYANVMGFEQNLQAWLTDCRSRKTASSPCKYAQNGDPGTKLINFMQRVDATPMAVGGRQLTRSLAMTGVLVTLYDQSSWPFLDQALVAADDAGDGKLLLQFADLFYAQFSLSANWSTYCLDHPVPTDIAAYDALGASFAQASPLFGPWSQYENLVCAYWPIKAKAKPGPLTANGAPPILLVGGSNDPATPYAWSVSVNKQLAGSVLLTRKGNGHTSYLSSSCAMQAEDAYLIDLTLPAPNTVCS